jgi:hypothetical protein
MALTKVGKEGITGISNSSNAAAITIDSSERVGIGEASPAAPLHVSTAAFTTAEIRLTSNNTGSGSGDRGRIAVYSSRNDGTAYEAGRIDIDRSSGTEDKAHIQFFTNDGSGASERLRILSGGGLTFNGDTAAANALDDYEEGTWTPADQTGSGVTISTLRAGYVKIGNMVHLHFYANSFSSSGVSAGAKISGLPFTNAANGWTCSLVQTGAGQISSQDLAVRVPAGEADVDFKGASLDTNVPWSHFNGTFMLWQITYQVD